MVLVSCRACATLLHISGLRPAQSDQETCNGPKLELSPTDMAMVYRDSVAHCAYLWSLRGPSPFSTYVALPQSSTTNSQRKLPVLCLATLAGLVDDKSTAAVCLPRNCFNPQYSWDPPLPPSVASAITFKQGSMIIHPQAAYDGLHSLVLECEGTLFNVFSRSRPVNIHFAEQTSGHEPDKSSAPVQKLPSPDTPKPEAEEVDSDTRDSLFLFVMLLAICWFWSR